MDADSVRRRVETCSLVDVVKLDPSDLLAAIDLHQQHRVSIWDALVLRAAIVAGCARLYTEDLQHGFRVDTLEVVNPFSR